MRPLLPVIAGAGSKARDGRSAGRDLKLSSKLECTTDTLRLSRPPTGAPSMFSRGDPAVSSAALTDATFLAESFITSIDLVKGESTACLLGGADAGRASGLRHVLVVVASSNARFAA